MVYILTNMRDWASNSQSRLAHKEGEEASPLGFDQLVSGFDFPKASYEMEAGQVSKYVEAVAVDGGWCHPDYVPPLAIAAYSLNILAKQVILPPGSVHASQELDFFKLVPVGTRISCQARIAQKVNRGKLHMLVIEFNASDESEEKILSGRATLILPS